MAAHRHETTNTVSGDKKSGTLYIVATPIGNLEDITFRAVRVLREVALIAAEDTRHTRKLLSHLNIHTRLLSYYKDKEVERAAVILEHLRAGDDVALVSDAGTPAISDPGSILVKKARTAGIRVVPVPGPSALTAAVSVSGFKSGSFLFLGFLPSPPAQRRKRLQPLAAGSEPIVFYESPQRIVKCLADCLDIFGDRLVVVARELTKIHEELLQGGISEVLAGLALREAGKGKVKGEFVVMVAGGDGLVEVPTGEDLHELLVWYRDHAGSSLRDAVKRIATDLGLSRSEVYKQALKVWEKEVKQ